MAKNSNTEIGNVLERNVVEVIDKEALLGKLKSGKKLRIKLGIDPTSPDIHIGRAVALWKLREFQKLGHRAVLIVGDFTGLIGDTSDKDAERPMLSEAQVKMNMKTYFAQAFKILDKSKTETRYNSEWLKKLGFLEISRLADLFGLHEFEARDMISRRLKDGKRVSLRELLYPLMQGYDSVAVKADVELGGTDQRFNLLAGRTIQSHYGLNRQDILMTEFPLEGLDGRKMSSSWGNGINISDVPNEMFGKVMSTKDELLEKYFRLATNLGLEEIKQAMKLRPIEAKGRLAYEICRLYHGENKAENAREFFKETFREKKLPVKIPTIKFTNAKLSAILLKAGVVESNSEYRRLIRAGAIEINSQVVKDPNFSPASGAVIKVGKRKYIKVV